MESMRQKVAQQENGVIKSPGREDVVQWAQKALTALSNQPDLKKRSFEATRITLNLDKVSSDRLGAALESCAEKPEVAVWGEFRF